MFCLMMFEYKFRNSVFEDKIKIGIVISCNVSCFLVCLILLSVVLMFFRF